MGHSLLGKSLGTRSGCGVPLQGPQMSHQGHFFLEFHPEGRGGPWMDDV